MNIYTIIGRYFFYKFKQRVQKAGVPAVALQMRKQGVPVAIAAMILGRAAA